LGISISRCGWCTRETGWVPEASLRLLLFWPILLTTRTRIQSHHHTFRLQKFAEWRELKGADSGEVFYELSLRKGLPQAVRSRGITVQAEESHPETVEVIVHRCR